MRMRGRLERRERDANGNPVVTPEQVEQVRQQLYAKSESLLKDR
jgi:hypothetical protein